MRVLWITTLWPEPPDTGGKLLTFGLVKHLALRGHEITLCPLTPPGDEATRNGELGALVDLCPSLRTPLPRRALPPVIRLFSARPYTVTKYWNERASATIRELLSDRNYDLLHLDHLHTAEYGMRARAEFGVPTVLTAHNVETALWEQLARLEPHPVKRAYLRTQHRKMGAYESGAAGALEAVHVLSLEDADRIRRLAPRVRPVVIAPGVDVEYFTPPPGVEEEPGSVAFVGALDWLPNVEGVRWFHREAWPRVTEAVDRARLRLVGRRPPRSIRRLAFANSNMDVVITGRVPDVRPYMARAQVLIVPSRLGSGVRLKILNALAMGKAVVSTSKAAEGLDLTDGRHLLVADAAEEFARCVIRLLSDPAERRRLGSAGRELVRAHHRWEEAAERLERVYCRRVRR